MNQNEIKKISEEMLLCYESAGRKNPESLLLISASIAEALNFNSDTEIHETFKRAKDIEPIPTQRTLKECLKNYREEVVKYSTDDPETKAIEYRDARTPWFPKEPTLRTINTMTAIKNYCDAIGGGMNLRYMKTHHVKEQKSGDRKYFVWENEDAVAKFDEPIKQYILYLYDKYIRQIPIYNGFPANGKIEIGMFPPSIAEFKVMLQNEGQI